MYKTGFMGENLINEISKKYCKGKYTVKKIIYLITLIFVFFCFTTETFASVKYNDNIEPYTVTKAYGPEPLRLIKVETVSKQQKNDTVYSQISNVTVVNSKQVKVKYDFWIVKFFKKLFSID